MRQVTTQILGTALATLLLIASAYANSVSFMPGNVPQPNEENILLNGANGTSVTGHTIEGHTNTTRIAISYTSLGTELSGKGGQSDIEALQGGLIHEITVAIA